MYSDFFYYVNRNAQRTRAILYEIINKRDPKLNYLDGVELYAPCLEAAIPYLP